MRLKGANAGHYEAGPNMTPLVDVVMVIGLSPLRGTRCAAT